MTYLNIVALGESSEAQDDDALISLRDDDLDDAFALEADQKTEKKFMSIILTNLHINYEGWRAELPQEEEEGEGEKKALEDGSGEEEKGDTADEERVSYFMCMLREDKGHCLRSQDTHQLLPLSISHMLRLCFILILK